MQEKFKIFAEFIKDLSSETKDLETYLYVSRNKFQILTLNKFTQKKFYDDK